MFLLIVFRRELAMYQVSSLKHLNSQSLSGSRAKKVGGGEPLAQLVSWFFVHRLLLLLRLQHNTAVYKFAAFLAGGREAVQHVVTIEQRLADETAWRKVRLGV